jgi:hypothetical protein
MMSCVVTETLDWQRRISFGLKSKSLVHSANMRHCECFFSSRDKNEGNFFTPSTSANRNISVSIEIYCLDGAGQFVAAQASQSWDLLLKQEGQFKA